MVLTINSTEVAQAVNLTRSASDGFAEARTTGDFAQEQNSSRWTTNTEAFNFSQAYRTRLLNMQEHMDTITELVAQFQEGLVGAEGEIEEVDAVIADHLDLIGSDTDGLEYLTGETVAE